MQYIKIFEDYTVSDYQKFLVKLTKKIKNGDSPQKLLKDISKYIDTNADTLDSIRLVLNRLINEYNKIRHRLYYNKRESSIKSKRKMGYSDYDNYFYYCPNIHHNKNGANFNDVCSFYISFIKSKKQEINNLLTKVEKCDRLELLFERLFEILDYVNTTFEETAKKVERQQNGVNGITTEDLVKSLSNSITIDVENEVDEVNKIHGLILSQLEKLMVK